MNDKFLNQITEFIFVEDKAEKSDMIFIPGSGFPQLAEEAAKLYHQGLAPYILPSGKYSILNAIGEPTRIAELRVFSTERAREFIESSSRMPI